MVPLGMRLILIWLRFVRRPALPIHSAQFGSLSQLVVRVVVNRILAVLASNMRRLEPLLVMQTAIGVVRLIRRAGTGIPLQRI